jgi:hypothetical protein
MAAKTTEIAEPCAPVPLPELSGRVAVLGGTASDKTGLLIGLALRQVGQQGVVQCLDARRHRQTEIQFRLLLRENANHVLLPASGEVPAEVAQTVLSTVSRSLAAAVRCPPLLLLDSVSETSEWEQTLSFLLKAGAVAVEFLRSPAALVFGRYDTVLLLRGEADTADALSRVVGRRVEVEDLESLPSGEGMLIHLARVYRVMLPGGQP